MSQVWWQSLSSEVCSNPSDETEVGNVLDLFMLGTIRNPIWLGKLADEIVYPITFKVIGHIPILGGHDMHTYTWICLMGAQKIKKYSLLYRFPKYWIFHWENKKSPWTNPGILTLSAKADPGWPPGLRRSWWHWQSSWLLLWRCCALLQSPPWTKRQWPLMYSI